MLVCLNTHLVFYMNCVPPKRCKNVYYTSFLQFLSRVSHDHKYILLSAIACCEHILVSISHEIYWHCDDIKTEDMAAKELEKYKSEFHDWQSEKIIHLSELTT